MSVDDYTLAAFLSGELSTSRRKSVAAALVQDRNAREVLHMACEALSSAMETPVGRQTIRERLNLAEARPGRLNHDRIARRKRAVRRDASH